MTTSPPLRSVSLFPFHPVPLIAFLLTTASLRPSGMLRYDCRCRSTPQFFLFLYLVNPSPFAHLNSIFSSPHFLLRAPWAPLSGFSRYRNGHSPRSGVSRSRRVVIGRCQLIPGTNSLRLASPSTLSCIFLHHPPTYSDDTPPSTSTLLHSISHRLTPVRSHFDPRF